MPPTIDDMIRAHMDWARMLVCIAAYLAMQSFFAASRFANISCVNRHILHINYFLKILLTQDMQDIIIML